MDRFGRPCGLSATLPRGQADPRRRALELGLNVSLLSVSHLRAATWLGAANIGDAEGFKGGKRRA
eukprot:13673917-Alexandrium_andersonii.AAC.1